MNPELRRNLWLEITTHRLLAMPVVLGLAFLALAAIDKPNAAEHVGWLGLGGFVVLTMFWGARLAGNSIIDEITDKTWDWQRLSTLAPWTMTWGKLFGATVFAWYGGLTCLGVFLATPMAAKPLTIANTRGIAHQSITLPSAFTEELIRSGRLVGDADKSLITSSRVLFVNRWLCGVSGSSSNKSYA